MPRRPRNEITHQRLQELLHYDAETGFFGWRVTRGQQIAGTRAGRVVQLGYWRVQVDRRSYFLHRLAWLYVHGVWPTGVVHHKNRDPGDNRIENLEDIGFEENLKLRRWGDPVSLSSPPEIARGKWWRIADTHVPKRDFNLSAATVRDLFSYDPDDGHLRWRRNQSNRKAGQIAGYINWQGRRLLCIGKKRFLAYRVIWLHVYGRWPKGEIDHINRDPLDNRIRNLREATRSQNMANQSGHRDSRTGLKGVAQHHTGKYTATCQCQHVRIIVFGLASADEALFVYLALAAEFHGEFAVSGSVASQFRRPEALRPALAGVISG